MHLRVRFHLDQVKSPRLTKALIDQSLNIANDFIYTRLCKMFQVDQQSRDGLRALTINNLPITPVGDTFTYPADYMQETALQTLVNGIWGSSVPVTYDELNELPNNYFTEFDINNRGHIESAAGTTCYFGTGSMTSGKLSYIKKYPAIYYSSTALTSASAIVVGTMYYVETAPVTHNAVTYVVGDTFTAVNTAFTGAGTVAAIQNSLLDDSLFEELCTRAAAFIAGSLEDYSRFQVKTVEENKS